MNTYQFIPSENLEHYEEEFLIRSKKNDIMLYVRSYKSALQVFQSFIKTLEIKDDVTLEGVNKFDGKLNTIWYSHKRKQNPFIIIKNN